MLVHPSGIDMSTSTLHSLSARLRPAARNVDHGGAARTRAAKPCLSSRNCAPAIPTPSSPPVSASAPLGRAAAAHRLLFQRIQELTPAGEPNERITAVVAPEAGYVFDLLATGLGDLGGPVDVGGRGALGDVPTPAPQPGAKA